MDKYSYSNDIFPEEIVVFSVGNIILTDKRILHRSNDESISKDVISVHNHVDDYVSYEDIEFVERKHITKNSLLILSVLVCLLSIVTSPEKVFMIIALLTSISGIIIWWFTRIPYLKIFTVNFFNSKEYNFPLNKIDNSNISRLIYEIEKQIYKH